MTSTDRCAACRHTGHFHRQRYCRAYVNSAAGLVPCPCKGFREPVTESEARLLDGNR